MTQRDTVTVQEYTIAQPRKNLTQTNKLQLLRKKCIVENVIGIRLQPDSLSMFRSLFRQNSKEKKNKQYRTSP